MEIIKNTITFKVREEKKPNGGSKFDVIEWHSFDHRHLITPEKFTQKDVDSGECMGGPTVASFYEKHMANEYAEIKNRQVFNGDLISSYDSISVSEL